MLQFAIRITNVSRTAAATEDWIRDRQVGGTVTLAITEGLNEGHAKYNLRFGN
jgi:hypothetical protein